MKSPSAKSPSVKSPAVKPPAVMARPARPTGLSRRELLKHLAVAVLALPALKLAPAVARADKRRRNHRGASDEIWIGHC